MYGYVIIPPSKGPTNQPRYFVGNATASPPGVGVLFRLGGGLGGASTSTLSRRRSALGNGDGEKMCSLATPKKMPEINYIRIITCLLGLDYTFQFVLLLLRGVAQEILE